MTRVLWSFLSGTMLVFTIHRYFVSETLRNGYIHIQLRRDHQSIILSLSSHIVPWSSNLTLVNGHRWSIAETRGQTLSSSIVTRRIQSLYKWSNGSNHCQVDLHRSMDFMKFEAFFCEASPADTYISWLRISQSFCETLSSGNSSTFLRLCVTDWNNRNYDMII